MTATLAVQKAAEKDVSTAVQKVALRTGQM
jgi:hypothetical protein